jgi:glycosyltransferase involved in cell wall biosynthesis
MKLSKSLKKNVKKLARIFAEIFLVIPCFCICIIARHVKRPIDVGLGPLPLINNVYHRKALRQAGFSAETFVRNTYFITNEFDIDLTKWRNSKLLKPLTPYYLFFRVLFRYRVLFIYFNGGPFIWKMYALHSLEPIFYRFAKVKVVVMPYGGDVQVLTRCKNLYFRHTVVCDYPKFWENDALNRKNIERWTRHAHWVISGADWVEYMYHWDTLMLGHFSIDMERWAPVKENGHDKSAKLRILHAPNHTKIKGTEALIAAIELLKREGLDIELILLQGMPNDEIRSAMENVDLVADQFVIGWYAMFAIEAMAMEKPVLCYLREDFIDLYVKAGLVSDNEIPLINTGLLEIAEKIRWAYYNREELIAIGKKGREFVQKHHSTEHVGSVFAGVLNELGIRGE